MINLGKERLVLVFWRGWIKRYLGFYLKFFWFLEISLEGFLLFCIFLDIVFCVRREEFILVFYF